MKKLLLSLITISLALTATTAHAANSSLGVAVQVLLGQEDSSKNINQNNKLWFVIEPGASGSRELLIASTSNIPQRISLSIGARKEVNGNLELDDTGKSVVNQWTSFSSNNFLLAPKKSQKVVMTIHVPKDANREVQQPAILIEAKAASLPKSQYKIPTAMRFTQGIFLGVGTADAFATKFTIDDVFGQTTNEGRMIFVRLSNIGQTPISPAGSIQFTNATFQGQTLGPYKFNTATIKPGQSGLAYLPADAQLTDDKWRIFVQAQMGQVVVTREIEKDLSFPTPSGFLDVALNIALILLALALALFALKILRRPKKAAVPENVFEAATADSKPRKQSENILVLFLIYIFKEARKRVIRRSN